MDATGLEKTNFLPIERWMTLLLMRERLRATKEWKKSRWQLWWLGAWTIAVVFLGSELMSRCCGCP